MATTGYLTLTGLIQGLSSGSVNINFPQLLFAAMPNFEIASFQLGIGGNTIGLVAGTNGLAILPPAGNTVLITLKGANSDGTGIPLHKTNWSIVTFDTSTTQFCLNAASAVTVQLIFF